MLGNSDQQIPQRRTYAYAGQYSGTPSTYSPNAHSSTNKEWKQSLLLTTIRCLSGNSFSRTRTVYWHSFKHQALLGLPPIPANGSGWRRKLTQELDDGD